MASALNSLRFLRLGKPLREGMTITLEPGIYFSPKLWDRWHGEQTHATLIDANVAERLMGLGGLRTEDNFVFEAGGAPAWSQDLIALGVGDIGLPSSPLASRPVEGQFGMAFSERDGALHVVG